MMDEAQFATFYEATVRGVLAFVFRTVGDRQLADDIVQDSYVRLLGANLKGTHDQAIKTYLYRIATNLMNDHWRRTARQERHENAVSQGTGLPIHHDVDLHVDVRTAMDQLPARQRTILWLAYVEGYDHRTIARIMDLGEKSIRVLLFRAKRNLADIMKRMGVEPE